MYIYEIEGSELVKRQVFPKCFGGHIYFRRYICNIYLCKEAAMKQECANIFWQ